MLRSREVFAPPWSLHMAFAVLIVGCGPGAAPRESTSSAAADDGTQDQLHEPQILGVFSGTDAQAMAALGRRLEGERPALSTALLDNMLALLGAELGNDAELRMMRAMLFRSAAIVIGAPARGALDRCIRTLPVFRDLCAGTQREIGY